jgi:hypothetical protein
MKWVFLVLSVLFVIVSLVSCTSMGEGYSPQDGQAADAYMNDMPMEAEQPAAASRAAPGTPMGAPVAPREIVQTSTNTATVQKPDEIKGRKKVYNGFCSLEVVDVEEVKDNIREYVLSVEGYIETSYDTRLTIRVPSEKFHESFQWILNQGKVLLEQIETYDVTDQFQDLEIKLKLAEETRERLYKLLERTTDTSERVRILREIRRLSEQIESLKASMELLQKSINFSRIDIQLQPMLADYPGQTSNIPFGWIRGLTPGVVSIPRLDNDVTLSPGNDFAVFSDRPYYYAESSRGIRISIGTTWNRPEGDNLFWQKALDYHLSPGYSVCMPVTIREDLVGVHLQSYDYNPFIYEIYLTVRGNQIVIIEMFYPDKEIFQEGHDTLKEVLNQVIIP